MTVNSVACHDKALMDKMKMVGLLIKVTSSTVVLFFSAFHNAENIDNQNFLGLPLGPSQIH